MFKSIIFIINTLTFPGVILYHFFCDLTCYALKIAVFEKRYFQFSIPNAYLQIERTDSIYKNLLIIIIPFLINSFVGFFIAFPTIFDIMVIKIPILGLEEVLNYLLFWLGVSIITHVFPSIEIIEMMKNNLSYKGSITENAFISPILLFFQIGTLSTYIGLNLLYGFYFLTFISVDYYEKINS